MVRNVIVVIDLKEVKANAPSRVQEILPGVLLTVGVVLIATLPLKIVPSIGLAAMSILTGAVLAPALVKTKRFTKGVDFSSKYLLQLSVVLSGFSIDFSQIVQTAKSSLIAIFTSISVALIAGFLLARKWKIDRGVSSLISVGTAICGASAIAAVSGPLNSKEDDRKLATSTIFTFNLAALFIFPVLGHLLHLSQHQFGVMAGGAVNDLSSVVATSHIYGASAQSVAIVVKLTRSLAIVPIVIAITVFETMRQSHESSEPIAKVVVRTLPKFILLFVLAAIVGNLTSHFGSHTFATISTYSMELALAGIGLSVARVRGAKFNMILFGAALWAIVTIATLANILL